MIRSTDLSTPCVAVRVPSVAVAERGRGAVVRRQVEVSGSTVLSVAGGGAWLVGSTALPSGPGTVVLAVGIAVTVWLVVRARQAGSTGARIDRDRIMRVVYLLAAGVGLVLLGSTLLRATGHAELTVPLDTALCGALLFPLAFLVERRGLLALGWALMLLGAGGAMAALDSAGRLESQGLVGFVGGVLLWAAAAQQAGLADELRARIRP